LNKLLNHLKKKKKFNFYNQQKNIRNLKIIIIQIKKMNKEAILILIDVGESMYENSFLDDKKSKLEIAIKFSELLIV
jgi:hypothetical protein